MSVLRKPIRTSLTELGLLHREINQLFERLAGFDRPEGATPGEWCPSVDVFECHGSVVIVAEVPGLPADALRVVCRDRTLVISGERRERRSAGGVSAFLCMERPHGRFTRKIPFDVPVDIREAEARLEGGLLTVTVPRLKDRRGRETVIPVQWENEE